MDLNGAAKPGATCTCTVTRAGHKMECSTDEAVAARVLCIATYSGSPFDIVVNYCVLCCTCVALLVSLGGRRVGLGATVGVGVALGLLGWFALFQIGLCLGVGCAGVSVIWCAAVGATLRPAQRCRMPTLDLDIRHCGVTHWHSALKRGTLAASVVTSAAAFVYYLLTAEAITTVAHILAFGLGYVSERFATWVADSVT